MLINKKILIAVTGSIAAYKTALIIRQLIKAGAEVKVLMTPSATHFITPLTLGTLSKNEVIYQLANDSSWANHVMLGRWADIMLIAPLSCNTLSKMATGTCDNLLTAVYLSATCPVVVAPAMDEDMWKHATTEINIRKIKSFGNDVIPVNTGELASGLSGEGRMAEPEQIIDWLNEFFKKRSELSGKKVLVTAGPTHESIDPVRFISNASSGKMGIALANELAHRGAEVTLVLGPTGEEIPAGVKIKHVITAEEMFGECIQIFKEMDWAVMCAAVADYTVKNKEPQKIKKTDEVLQLELRMTKDILKTLGQEKKENQCLVGFALETQNEKVYALSKLQTKNADMIVLNSLNDEGAGFKGSTNKITIFDKKGGETHFDTKSKTEIAKDIINTISKYTNG